MRFLTLPEIKIRRRQIITCLPSFLSTNQENQFLEYTLTIHGMTFEDEKDLLLTVKSSKTETVKVIKPVVTGRGHCEREAFPSRPSLFSKEIQPVNCHSHQTMSLNLCHGVTNTSRIRRVSIRTASWNVNRIELSATFVIVRMFNNH